MMRAAYGIFYAGFENLGGAPDPGTNYPFAVEPTISDTSGGTQTLQSQNPSSFPNGGFATLERALTLVTPSATSPAFNPVGSSFEAFATPWKTGYTHEWNFELQYALTRNDSIQVGFVGNHSLHQINGSRINQINLILPPGTVTQNYVPFRDFAQSRDYIAPNGDAYYYGLQATYQRRFSNGLALLANYTHSRCMSDFRNILGDDNPGGLQRALFLPGFGIKKDYTFCADDAPNVFHLSGTWQIPLSKGLRFGHSAGWLANGILGGWSVNGILTSQNGFPGTEGCLSSTTAGFGCVAFLVPGQSVYLHQGPHEGIDKFLNPAAFSQPPVATAIGQSDYTPLGGKAGQFHGPSFNNLDFSIFKSFPMRERSRFEFRGEGFNILNHPNFGNSFTRLGRLAQLQPKNARALYYYAMSSWMREQDGQANLADVEALLKQAIAQEPGYADAHLQLGILFMDQRKEAQSIQEFERASMLEPTLTTAHYHLARAYARAGQKSRAEQEMQVFERYRKKDQADAERDRKEVRQFVLDMKDQSARAATR